MWAKATPSKAAAGVAEFLAEVFTQNGAPTYLHSDNAAEFRLVSMLLADQHGFTDKQGKPYTPRHQGSVEKANDIIGHKLEKHTIYKHVTWVQALPNIIRDYNRSPSTVTKMTPFFVC